MASGLCALIACGGGGGAPDAALAPADAALLASGATCTSDGQCTSGVCDVAGSGRCCSAACTTTGTCGATSCDTSGACVGPTSTTSCGSAVCSGATLTPAGTCDGSGGCTAGTGAACSGGFICASATACETACAADSDCASTSDYCKTPGGSGTCVARSALAYAGGAGAAMGFASALEPASTLTVEGWAVQSGTGSAGTHTWVVGEGNPFGGTPSGYRLGYDWSATSTALPSFYVVETPSGGGATLLGCAASSAPSAGVHHLAGTFDGTSGVIAVWVDGVQACTATATGTSPFALTYVNATTVTLAYDGANAAASFTGTLDDIRISNTVLYTATFTAARHPTVGASTVALWPMDEGSGTSIADSSTTGSNSVAFGGGTWVAEP